MVPQIGDRVEITGLLPNDPNPLPVGAKGTVVHVGNVGTKYEQYRVDWDDDVSRLMLLSGDPFKIIEGS